jgi:hypothetical protein
MRGIHRTDTEDADMKNRTLTTLTAAALLAAAAATADPRPDASTAIGEQGRAAMVSIQAEIAHGVTRESTHRLAALPMPNPVGATLTVATNEARLLDGVSILQDALSEKQ